MAGVPVWLNKYFLLIIVFLCPDIQAQLKVYKSDGTTVLGNFLKASSADVESCYAATYADVTTGAVSQLPAGACSTVATATVYFSNSNCTGNAYGIAGAGARRFRTGTGNNISICEDSGMFVNFYTYSSRTWAGACVNTGGVYQTGGHWRYDTNCVNTTDICGGSACVVK